MEGWAEENSPAIRYEGDAESPRNCQEKCALGYEWEKILKLVLSSTFGKYELCLWRQRELVSGNRSHAGWWLEIPLSQE